MKLLYLDRATVSGLMQHRVTLHSTAALNTHIVCQHTKSAKATNRPGWLQAFSQWINNNHCN